MFGFNPAHVQQSSLQKLLKEMGKHKEALPLCTRALAIREDQLGPNHPDTATSVSNLAVLLKERGEDKGEEGGNRLIPGMAV